VSRSSARERAAWRPLALVSSGLLLLAIGGAAQQADATTGPAKIRITNQETRYSVADVGRRGRSSGDQEISWHALTNTRIRQRPIGRAEMICTWTFGDARLCRATYVLPKGKIMVGGQMRFRQVYQLAIVGGTGLFDNARGTLTVRAIKRRPRQERLVFELVG
jgi:hypothetical protein